MTPLKEANNMEEFITAENTAVTMHFRLVCGNSNLPLDDFKHVRNEIIVDSYFQIEPICCVEKGDWPKTRQTITDNGGSLETKNSFIYKGKTKKYQDNNGIISYEIASKNSLFELTEYIFKIFDKQDKPTHQEYFATTIILRQVFQHKQNPKISLHIGNLSLGHKFYIFGKLVMVDGTKEEINELFNKLNPSDSVLLIPANTPVIQKLLHNTDECFELLEKVKDHYCIQASYSRSISGKLFLVDGVNVDKELINRFNMLCDQEED